jgi:hypothetical protein
MTAEPNNSVNMVDAENAALASHAEVPDKPPQHQKIDSITALQDGIGKKESLHFSSFLYCKSFLTLLLFFPHCSRYIR